MFTLQCLKFFCVGDLSIFSLSFIQSFIYQHGLMNIYFTFWAINQYNFIYFVAQVFSFLAIGNYLLAPTSFDIPVPLYICVCICFTIFLLYGKTVYSSLTLCISCPVLESALFLSKSGLFHWRMLL